MKAPTLQSTIELSAYLQWNSGNFLSTEGILRANFAITKYLQTLNELSLNFCMYNMVKEWWIMGVLGAWKGSQTKFVRSWAEGFLRKWGVSSGLLWTLTGWFMIEEFSLRLNRCEMLTNEALGLFSPENCQKRRLKALEQLTLEFSE